VGEERVREVRVREEWEVAGVVKAGEEVEEMAVGWAEKS
jgi:hypothetical protein